MTIYGDKVEPGIVTDLTSSAAVPISGDVPSDVGLIGQADLANARSPADTSKVYQVTRASKAVEWFGPRESSMLTTAVIDALNEGAYPVYATVAESTSVVDEEMGTIDGGTTSVSNAPIRESPDSITVTLDGTELTTNKVYEDVTTFSPASDECFYNPVRGNIQLPTGDEDGDSTNDYISYDHFNYESAINVMVDKVGDVVDFLAPISENRDVVDKANLEVSNMEKSYNLAIAVGGAEIDLDPVNYEPQYDDSRTQVVYPTRFEDGSSAIASYVGFKASLGLTTTPINRRLSTNKSLRESMNRAQRGSLIDENVVPLANEPRGIRIVDDPTTVSQTNTDEMNLNYGFNRLVADYIIETVYINQKPFIGKLNSQTVRNTLEEMVNEVLNNLQESDAVIEYQVNIVKEDAVTAGVEMYVDLVEPLRFIENTLTIGGTA